jgi:hypothetical protein
MSRSGLQICGLGGPDPCPGWREEGRSWSTGQVRGWRQRLLQLRQGCNACCRPVAAAAGGSEDGGWGAFMVSEMPETRFTRAGEVDIAYQVVGPPAALDLLFIPGWVSHLEVMWELPEFTRFLDRLAAMGRLIMFDKRGTGLSDRVAGMPALEQRADDIAAVMDAAGSGRAALVAWGEGAAIAVVFAATHPQACRCCRRARLGPDWCRCSRRLAPRTPGSCPGTGGGNGCRRRRAPRRPRYVGRRSSIWGRSCLLSRPGR